jgi:hypothetical protein
MSSVSFGQPPVVNSSMPAEHASSSRTMGRNLKLLAISTVAIMALAELPMAGGGPLAYASCVAGCEALATVATGGPGAAFIMNCIAACWPILAMPSP